jgi:hypothetical protein
MNDEDAIALHRYQQPESWGAKLEDGGCWILSAAEGSTPEDALSNLQVAISQVGAINAAANELAMAKAKASQAPQMASLKPLLPLLWSIEI